MMAMLVESGVVYTAVWIIYAVYNDVGSLDRSAGFFWSNFYMAPLSVSEPHYLALQGPLPLKMASGTVCQRGSDCNVYIVASALPFF